jgi:hypothetical protein
MGDPGRKYAQERGASKKISEASPLPRSQRRVTGRRGSRGWRIAAHREQNSSVTGSRIFPRVLCDETGRKDRGRWEGSFSAQLCGPNDGVWYGREAEEDIHIVRVILAAKGYVLGMREWIKDPNGKKYHQGDWGSNGGVAKKKSGH